MQIDQRPNTAHFLITSHLVLTVVYPWPACARAHMHKRGPVHLPLPSFFSCHVIFVFSSISFLSQSLFCFVFFCYSSFFDLSVFFSICHINFLYLDQDSVRLTKRNPKVEQTVVIYRSWFFLRHGRRHFRIRSHRKARTLATCEPVRELMHSDHVIVWHTHTYTQTHLRLAHQSLYFVPLICLSSWTLWHEWSWSPFHSIPVFYFALSLSHGFVSFPVLLPFLPFLLHCGILWRFNLETNNCPRVRLMNLLRLEKMQRGKEQMTKSTLKFDLFSKI